MRLRSLIGLAGMLVVLQGCAVALVAGGIGAAAMVANERRASEAMLADERLEWESSRRLRGSGQWESLNVNVTSYNRMLLLTGQAANEQARAAAERIVAEVPNVRGVANEMVVGNFSNFAARSNDTLITTQVKSRFVAAEGFNPGHVKVLTEAGVVYLLGLVTPTEGERAARVAATTQGVSRVVKVFEYIADAPQAETSKN